MFRRAFLLKHARYYDVFFRSRVDTFVQTVLMDAMGVKDWLVRYEYQARTAIHAHLLVVLPLGIDLEQRKAAFFKHKPEDMAWAKRVFESESYTGIGADGSSSTPIFECLEARKKIVEAVSLRIGLVESHPSCDPSDWYVIDGGNLMHGPIGEVIRGSLEERLVQPAASMINLVNKVGLHTCRDTYCRKAKKVQAQTAATSAAPAQPSPQEPCRFAFPRQLIGFQHRFDDDGDGIVGVDRVVPPRGNGMIFQITDLSSKHCGKVKLRMRRNLARVVSHNADLLMIWGANIEVQYIEKEQAVKEYVTKYICKAEQMSEAGDSFAKNVFDSTGEDDVRKFTQKMMMSYAKSHDFSLAESFLYLNKADAMVFSRDFVYVNPLGDGPVTLAVANNEAPVGLGVGNIYDRRADDPNFQLLIQAYESSGEDVKPLLKHP